MLILKLTRSIYRCGNDDYGARTVINLVKTTLLPSVFFVSSVTVYVPGFVYVYT